MISFLKKENKQLLQQNQFLEDTVVKKLDEIIHLQSREAVTKSLNFDEVKHERAWMFQLPISEEHVTVSKFMFL